MNAPSFTLLDASQAIWVRRRLVASFLLLTVLLVGLATCLTPKSYTSHSKVFVRLGRENTSLDVTAGLGENPFYSMPLSRDAEINSIAEMVHNKDLFGKVVDRVGANRILKKKTVSYQAGDNSADQVSLVDVLKTMLQGIGLYTKLEPREKAIIVLQKRTGVQASEKSNVISVGIAMHDPSLAQDIVSAIVEEYQKQHTRTNRSQGGNEFLAEQTAAIHQRLNKSEKRFEEFKNNTHLISVEDQRKVLVDRLAKIENELLETEAATQSMESEISAIKMLSSNMAHSERISQKEGAGNEGIDGMRQELFRLQVKKEEMLAMYPADSPKVTAVIEQLTAAKKIFENSESQLVESVEGPNKIYQDAQLDLNRKEPMLAALTAKSAVLQSQLEKEMAALTQFNANETEFIRLHRDMQIDDENFIRLHREMQIDDENFKRYNRSLQQASMDHSLQESNLSNLSIFQPASFNPKPASPNALTNLLAGMALGVLGGCALAVLLEYRQRYSNQSRVSAELESSLELPVVATIPRQPRRTLVRTN